MRDQIRSRSERSSICRTTQRTVQQLLSYRSTGTCDICNRQERIIIEINYFAAIIGSIVNCCARCDFRTIVIFSNQETKLVPLVDIPWNTWIMITCRVYLKKKVFPGIFMTKGRDLPSIGCGLITTVSNSRVLRKKALERTRCSVWIKWHPWVVA